MTGDIESLHLPNSVKAVVIRDSRIQQDSDQVCQLKISDESSMMQRKGLAIDNQTHKIDKALVHVMDEKGGGVVDGGCATFA